MPSFGDPVGVIRSMLQRIVEQQRRQAGMEMRGKVTKVDPDKGLARIEIGKTEDGETVESPWLPYRQIAGALKVHYAPTVGQSMSLRSENGDITQGVIEPFGWSDANPANSTDGGATVITLGDVHITMTSSSIVASIGGSTFEFSAAGFKQTGGQMRHNDKNVGSSHIHGGVTPGGGTTDVPAN